MNDIPRTNYMVWPTDSVEELLNDDSGDSISGTLPGIYRQLRDAGLPVSNSQGTWADMLDFSVDANGKVVAYTENPGKEHPFPLDAVRQFLDRWKEAA